MNWLSMFQPLNFGDILSLSPSRLANLELRKNIPDQFFQLNCISDMGESFVIDRMTDGWILTGGEAGILYGAYEILRSRFSQTKLPDHLESSPRYSFRMIDCWDNMDGSVERGYAGRSLFFDRNRFSYNPDRIVHLGRMMASVGLNILCLNNVNVHEPAQELIADMIPELSALADLLRPFGIRIMTSVDFSMPIRAGLENADPLSSEVQIWWNKTVSRIYKEIPDFAGFLVKADSEGRPGPFTYKRSHADGANMLAKALHPFGGILVWRCFVYNCLQDWRDNVTDRPKAAYDTYQPLDGQFDENVILQVKNGPWDFQVREPISPLFFSMNYTSLGLELQLTQEYTGQQIDLYAMPTMWQELFQDLPATRIQAIAAVSNLGRDDNYFGHPLAAVNFFGFGLLAWNPQITSKEIFHQWIRLTYQFSDQNVDQLASLLNCSRRIYECYTSPLGLSWMVTPHTHYGPNPSGYEYDVWGTYHRADRNAVGVDRTAEGTGFILQLPSFLQDRYKHPYSCPDLLLLFFHRVPYTFIMHDGRSLIQRIYDDHFEGADQAKALADQLKRLPFPSEDLKIICERADLQIKNAENWRDTINTFFHRLSGIPDIKNRKIYD